MSHDFNPFAMAQQQFDAVAEKLDLDPGVRGFLRWPQRELHFTIPVKMDDGSTQVFHGFRVQHSTARGPAKGGIRFHQTLFQHRPVFQPDLTGKDQITALFIRADRIKLE